MEKKEKNYIHSKERAIAIKNIPHILSWRMYIDNVQYTSSTSSTCNALHCMFLSILSPGGNAFQACKCTRSTSQTWSV